MDTIHVNVRVPYVTLVIGTILSLGAAWLFYQYSGVQNSVQVAAQLFAAGIASTAVTYSAIGMHLNAGLTREKVEADRRAAAIALITEWQRPDMAKITILTNELRTAIKDLEPKQVLALLKGNADKEAAMVVVLNFCEKLSLCVAHGVVTEDIVRDFFGTIVLRYHHALSGLIQHKRKEFGNSDIFARFEELATRWK